MTLIEVLVALAIAFGAIAAAVDASRLAVDRAIVARLHTEAEVDAESELLRVGRDLPLKAGNFAGATASGLRWTVEIQPLQGPANALRAFRVSSAANITRAGVTADASITTLKLDWPVR